jgi:hypothetical protein
VIENTSLDDVDNGRFDGGDDDGSDGGSPGSAAVRTLRQSEPRGGPDSVPSIAGPAVAVVARPPPPSGDAAGGASSASSADEPITAAFCANDGSGLESEASVRTAESEELRQSYLRMFCNGSSANDSAA